MKRYFFPFHVGTGNRGCEGIIRGTIKVCDLDIKNTFLLDKDESDLDLDNLLLRGECGELEIRRKRNLMEKALNHFGLFSGLINASPFKRFLKKINKDDLVFFTGGDLYCYSEMLPTNKTVFDFLYKKQVPMILWGASLEEKLCSEDLLSQFKKFNRIVVRESISYQTLLKKGINKNVYLYPDPAFSLEPKRIELPEMFSNKKVIGINVSPMVNNGNSMDTVFIKNLEEMFKYILNETEYSILIIPHTTWEKQDDRVLSKLVAARFDCERVQVLDVDKMDYLQIRYVISHCYAFIGARTHSVISAYATCVPTIALGYSVKARGIAYDLGIPEQLVVNCKQLDRPDILLSAFSFLEENRSRIYDSLKENVPEYRRRSLDAKNGLEGVL